jgi:hypothetical protein
MPTADTKHSLVVIKEFTYRGGTRTFSNRYHFEGDLPSDDAAWIELADAVVTAEKPIYADDVTIVQALGYDAGSASSSNPHGDSVFSKAYTTAGTGDFSTDGRRATGDSCVLLRYSTPARSSRNHPVYLFNYFHGAWQLTSVADSVSAVQISHVETYAEDWIDGFVCEGSPRERCGPRGAVATGRRVDPFVRHRDFPN